MYLFCFFAPNLGVLCLVVYIIALLERSMSDRKYQFKSISLFTAGVITTISITLVLFLLGATFLVWFTGKGFSSYLKENMGISIEISNKMSDAEIAQTKKQLEANPYIKSVVYITKDEIKKQLVEDMGQDPEEILGFDPSRSYFDIFIKSQYMNPDSLKVVEKSLQGQTVVKNFVYDESDIAKANTNLSMVGTILLVVAIILTIISFILIRSIIQLNIYSKRFIINTMQLVGATNSFIRRPFMGSMLVCGIIAAFLANAAITGVVYYIANIFPVSVEIVSQMQLFITYGLVLLFGILITLMATISAVNRYLRMTTNKLYKI